MAMELNPLHGELAAEVDGVDLRQMLDSETLAMLKSALARYPVLVFHDQKLSDDQHAAFTRSFGPIDAGLVLAAKRKRRLKNTDVIDLANIDIEGNIIDSGSARNVSLIANQMWHSDSSFKDPPAQYSILCGIDLPAVGGETEFADQRAAYDALGEADESADRKHGGGTLGVPFAQHAGRRRFHPRGHGQAAAGRMADGPHDS